MLDTDNATNVSLLWMWIGLCDRAIATGRGTTTLRGVAGRWMYRPGEGGRGVTTTELSFTLPASRTVCAGLRAVERENSGAVEGEKHAAAS
jgi:hypothetical protein